jgi:hypothetical protein
MPVSLAISPMRRNVASSTHGSGEVSFFSRI